MGHDVRVVEEDHPVDEVVDEGRDEHVIQLDVPVLQDVLERPLVAEVRDQGDAVGVHAGANKTEGGKTQRSS